MNLDFLKKLERLLGSINLIRRTPNTQRRTEDSQLLTYIPTRRRFFPMAFGGFTFLCSSIPCSQSRSGFFHPSRGEGGRSITEFFKGEELVYQVGVWVFKRVAMGKMEL